MSFRRLLDRTVSIIPREVASEDARGDEVLEDGTPIPDVPAARDLVDSSETLEDRDGVSRRWVYFLPAFLDDGTALQVDAYSRILDGTELLEVVGTPELVTRRRGSGRGHHWELEAERRA